MAAILVMFMGDVGEKLVPQYMFVPKNINVQEKLYDYLP